MLNNNNIVKHTDKNLFKKSKDLLFPLSREHRKTIEKMRNYCWKSQDPEKAIKYNLTPCVGLAGCQVNFFYNVFCILIRDEDGEYTEKVIINPEIYSYSYQKTYISGGEGCLSVDDQYEGVVPRVKTIKLSGYDYLTKTNFTAEWDGLLSIVAQHEYDHLQGKLYYQRAVTSDNIENEWIAYGDKDVK